MSKFDIDVVLKPKSGTIGERYEGTLKLVSSSPKSAGKTDEEQREAIRARVIERVYGNASRAFEAYCQRAASLAGEDSELETMAAKIREMLSGEHNSNPGFFGGRALGPDGG